MRLISLKPWHDGILLLNIGGEQIPGRGPPCEKTKSIDFLLEFSKSLGMILLSSDNNFIIFGYTYMSISSVTFIKFRCS